jgi:phage terminase large subunit-like protein
MRGKPEFTLGPQVAAWIETFCVHGPGDVMGQPVELTREEKRFLAWAYEVNRDGKRVVRRSLVGLPKGSRKTAFLAWISICEVAGPVRFSHFEDEKAVGKRVTDSFVVVAAASYDQAALLFDAASKSITQGPLKDYFDVFEREIQLKGESGKMIRVASVSGTNDGLLPSFFAADEVHEWTGSKRRVHLVIENGLAKREGSWSCSITTAGNPKQESVGLTLYEYGKRVDAGEIDDPGFLFLWREPSVNVDNLHDEATLMEALQYANPEPWKRLDDLKRRFREVALHEGCRYFLNLWVEPDEERWLPPGAWGQLVNDRIVPDGTRIVLGFDGSYSGDSTALVAATVEEVPHLWVLGLWEHPGGNVAWKVDHEVVEAAVVDAFRRFDVAEMSADPPYWAQQLTRWQEMFGEDRVIAFNTFVRKRMAAACSSFYQAATSAGLTHDGHPGLARHIDNAVLKETAQGAYITKEHKSSHRKIDGGIAAVICWNRSRWHYDNPKVEPKEWVWV